MGLTRDWPYSDLHSMNLDWIIETIQTYTQRTDEALETVEEKVAYIDSFFNNLDVQQEINNKLDEMSESGDLARLLQPIAEAWLAGEVPQEVTNWLNNNITPGSGVVDASLSVSGAAADARAAGLGIGGAAAYAHDHPRASWSRNIFDMNTENKLAEHILNAETRTIQTVGGYTAYAVPVVGGQKISTQGAGAWFAHIVVLDHYVDLTKMRAGDVVTGVVNYWHDTGATELELAPTAKCLILSTNNAVQAMIVYGKPSLVWAEYSAHDFAMPCDPAHEAVHVGAGRAYSRISEAVEAAPDGATIIIHEGRYNESVHIPDKTLYIYGVGRDSVVIYNDGGNYLNPPVEMISGMLCNLTLLAEGGPQAEGAEDKAYCLHVEGGYMQHGRGKSLIVQNVKMINQDTEANRPCVGAGLLTDYTLALIQCDMHSYSGPCIYAHNYSNPPDHQDAESTNQHLHIIDCYLKSDSTMQSDIMLQSQEIADHMAHLLAQRNILVSNVRPYVNAFPYTTPVITGTGYLGTSNWSLDDGSMLNNAEVLNASEPEAVQAVQEDVEEAQADIAAMEITVNRAAFTVRDDSTADLNLSDINGNVIMKMVAGWVKTRQWDSQYDNRHWKEINDPRPWCIIGDSLSENNQRTTEHYWNYIQNATGIPVHLLAHSGAGYYARPSDYTFRRQALLIPTNSKVITIFGSGNDLDKIPLGDVGDTTADTLCGCMYITLQNVWSRITTANLGIITPTPWQNYSPTTPGNDMELYVEALKEICKRYSVPVLDLYHCSNLRPDDAAFRAAAYSKDDGNGIHPDEVGHALIAPHVQSFLESLLMH